MNEENNDFNQNTYYRNGQPMDDNRIVNDAFNAAGYDRPAEMSLAGFQGITFAWMIAGLLVTFACAFLFLQSGLAYAVAISGPAAWILPVAEIAVVMILSLAVRKLSTAAATGLYFVYAILTGVSFSEIFLIFDVSTVIFVFLMAAVYFAVLALITLVFKLRLNGLGVFLMGALLMLLVMQIINVFVPSTAYSRVCCYIGILIFSGYTAYDTGKLTDYYEYYSNSQTALGKASIYGALELYLDFVNLFLYLLRLFGGSGSSSKD